MLDRLVHSWWVQGLFGVYFASGPLTNRRPMSTVEWVLSAACLAIAGLFFTAAGQLLAIRAGRASTGSSPRQR